MRTPETVLVLRCGHCGSWQDEKHHHSCSIVEQQRAAMREAFEEAARIIEGLDGRTGAACVSTKHRGAAAIRERMDGL